MSWRVPLVRLKAMDNNGLLRRTLAGMVSAQRSAAGDLKALFIHRNTLEYRLNRISRADRAGFREF